MWFADFPEKRRHGCPEKFHVNYAGWKFHLQEEFAKKVPAFKETWPARASEYCFVVNSAGSEPVAASLIRKSGSIISIHFRRVARVISKGVNSVSKTGLRSWRFNRMFQLRVARRWEASCLVAR